MMAHSNANTMKAVLAELKVLYSSIDISYLYPIDAVVHDPDQLPGTWQLVQAYFSDVEGCLAYVKRWCDEFNLRSKQPTNRAQR
jgi:hypothetical protein